MNKCIIEISGTMRGKALFWEIVEDKMKLKIKGADCDYGLQEIICLLGWDGETYDKCYRDFYNELFKTANELFNFKRVYLNREIEKFQEDQEYQILVMKGSNELEKELEDYSGIISVLIAKNQAEYDENILKYDKIILLDENFENNVKKMINILLKENVKV